MDFSNNCTKSVKIIFSGFTVARADNFSWMPGNLTVTTRLKRLLHSAKKLSGTYNTARYLAQEKNNWQYHAEKNRENSFNVIISVRFYSKEITLVMLDMCSIISTSTLPFFSHSLLAICWLLVSDSVFCWLLLVFIVFLLLADPFSLPSEPDGTLL